MLNGKLAIVILTCDHYSDLWKPFFQLFDKHWKNSPYKVYLASNEKKVEHVSINTLLSGADKDWSSSVKGSINQLDEEYVLLLLDDVFFTEDVDFEALESLLQTFIKLNMNYLKMKNSPKPDIKVDSILGGISAGSLYRTAIYPSMWKKSTLLELLKDGESAWEFELKGAVRSNEYDGFYSLHENFFSEIHGVIKGKWTKNAYKKLSELNMDIDIEKRGVMSFNDDLKLGFVNFRSKIFKLVPMKYRVSVRSFVYKKILKRNALI